MARKNEAVDDLLDALVWMRRKAKRHEAVDDLIDALIGMRRKAKIAAAKRKVSAKTKRKAGLRKAVAAGKPADKRRPPRGR
jgi:hypothetical protein